MAALLLDHNVLNRLTRLVEDRGHSAMTVGEIHLEAASDAEILSFSGRYGLILVTCDEDFVGLHTVRHEAHAGILWIPPVPADPPKEAVNAADALRSILDSNLPLSDTLYRLTGANAWERWDDERGWTAL